MSGDQVEFRKFAFVVDGEVAWVHSMPADIERGVACFLSNPTIVEVTGEVKDAVFSYGWKYDGENFFPDPDIVNQ
jgi:hypothetical protein